MWRQKNRAGRTLRAILLSLLLSAALAAEDSGNIMDAAEVLQKCDAAEGYESSFAEAKQTITTTGGQKRTLQIRAWAVRSGEKQLFEYLAPADIRGQKILMTNDGDDIWMFNPETRRTRKLGSHMKKRKVMGSDFTYEDQAGGKLVEKYTAELLGTEDLDATSCYVLDMKPTPKGPSYSRVLAWIGKEDFITRRIDFYQDNDAKPFKRLLCSDVREAGAKMVAFNMTMTNLEDRSETINILARIQFGVDIPESVFESRRMAR
jgi:outer membrane lipoprotein-sorting protein